MHVSTLLVARLALLLGLAGAALLGAAFAHAVGRVGAERRSGPRAEAATAQLIVALAGADVGPAAAALGRLPRRRRLEVLLSFSERVSGGQRDELSAIARACGVDALGARWRGTRRSWRRLHGVRLGLLLGTPPDEILAWLADRSPEVRAAAAEWAVVVPRPEVIARLLELLDDPQARCRFAVMDTLVRMGSVAAASIARELATANPPGRLRQCLDVALHIGDASFGAPATALLSHPDPMVRARAAQLVGATITAAPRSSVGDPAAGGGPAGGGGPAAFGGLTRAPTTVAIDRLAALINDPDPDVRAAAAAGLGRGALSSSAPAVASMLGDQAWVVRRAAALALLEMGADGRIALERALGDTDRYAADMARLVLSTSPPRG